MGLASLVERAPLSVRAASVAASVALLSVAVGEPRLAFVGVAAAAASLAPVAAQRLRGLPARVSVRGGEEKGGDGYYAGFEIAFTSNSQATLSEVSRLIADRARLGGSRIMVASILEASRGKVAVLVYSRDPEKVKVDYEVLKTMLASTGEVRIRELSESEARLLASVASSITPASKPAAMIPGLPSQGQAPERGLVKLGVRLDSPLPEPVYLTSHDLEGHVAIFGSTGTGKSTTLAALACNAWKSGRLRVVVVDWTGEHFSKMKDSGCQPRYLDPLKDAPINPLSRAESEDDNIAVVEALSAALTLTEPQEYMLLKILEEGRPRTLDELEAMIEAAPESSRWDREVKRALQRKIAALTRGASKKAFASGVEAFPPTQEPLVIDASRIPSLQARRAYALLALWLLYKRSDPESPVLVAVDEAHNIAVGEEGLLSKLMAEARKRGLRIAAATQSPSLMPTRILANSNTKIIHALRSHRDLEVVRETLYLPGRLVEKLPSLDRGEALLHSPSQPNPILVKVER